MLIPTFLLPLLFDSNSVIFERLFYYLRALILVAVIPLFLYLANFFALFLACIFNGVAEEIVMRGYFIERLEYLLGSTSKGIIFSSILFSSYHIYQGGIGTFYVFIFGVIYGIIYCKYRRIWPLAIAHSLHNIVSFGLMPS